MNQLEQNIVVSFQHVKDEVIGLRQHLEQMRLEQQHLILVINETREKEISLYNSMKGIKVQVAHQPERAKFFIASKQGKSAHEENCPFAKNIKADRKLVFDSKMDAFEAGFKPCECMSAC
jgi:hypothetical protein